MGRHWPAQRRSPRSHATEPRSRPASCREPVCQSCEAPDGAQPGAHPPCDAHALGGRDLAVRNPRQNSGQNLPAILGRAHRFEVDPELRCRVEGSRWRQQLLGEHPQQLRLAVEQIGQRLRAQPPSSEIRHAAPRIWNTRRAAERVAGASLREGARARRAREAEKDQDQVVEIPGLPTQKTGGNRRTKADRLQFPASAGLRANGPKYAFMIRSYQGQPLRHPAWMN